MIPKINSERKLARRLILLASGIGLGAATFFTGPGGAGAKHKLARALRRSR